jgi:hypothetical protein
LDDPDGKCPDVSYLLVNDDDGMILAVLERMEEAASALEEAGRKRSPVPLAVVAFREAAGSIVATQTSVTMRPLE